MKSFSEFTRKSQVAEANITKDKFYKNEVYKKGEWVLTENGQVGKILRRGPNYVLCLTAEETTFRTWITNIKEVFEIGTDAYREYVMSLTPGQKTVKPKGTEKVKQTIPTDPKKDKMSHHEEKTLAQIAADTMLNTKFKSINETWRYDYSAKIGNTDVKGLGADGVGGGDAPGMKLAEPSGTEGKPTIKKVKHSCATKVEHAEWGRGNCLKEMHTLDEQGNVSHYDVMFEHGLEQDVPVATLNLLEYGMHEHAINPDKPQREIEQQPPNQFVDDKIPAEVKTEGNLDPVNHSELKGKHKDRKDKDIDNDGDVDSSDKYLHKKRKAISKAIKNEETIEEKKGLYANIHAKRERGEKMRSKGDKGAPTDKAFKDSEKTAKKEEVANESLKQARKNVGASTCWDGYKAKGTKMKNGRKVPNCVKEFSEWRKLTEKK